MGVSISVECPVEGCSYRETFRLGMGAETKGTGAQAAELRAEHPNHTDASGEDQTATNDEDIGS
jgi:hypothetical protein